MSKLIIFCADGTWDGPGRDGDGGASGPPTNVYKLFLGLAGTLQGEPLPGETEKQLRFGSDVMQVAKYLHGVGHTRNAISRVLGGAFGAGVISRIVRGYTFVSRNYQPGDGIVLIGFSRGAYTVRALAGMIALQGLLSPALTSDRTAAYRWGAMAWYRYRKECARSGIADRLAEAVASLPAFLASGALRSADLVPVPRIHAVAVWDTVGALGIPCYVGDSRTDAFRFCDTALSPKVQLGLHAVSLDEQRVDFTPTLWDPRERMMQLAFPGAHADVGAGYPTGNGESALSDVALDWIVQNLRKLETPVRFRIPFYEPFRPDPAGMAHKPWLHAPFQGCALAPRVLPAESVGEHPAVQARIDAGLVVAEPGEAATRYDPPNRPLQKAHQPA